MESQKLGFLRSVLYKWHSQATLIGKAVLPVFLLVRLVILGVAEQRTWLTEEDEFVCNTAEPGCETACYRTATPLSPPRLWTLQLVLVLASGLVFLCYLIHLTNQDSQVRTRNGAVKGRTLGAYLACTTFVILVEVGSVVAQSLLYGFWVSESYVCSAYPCPHTVDCIIPHAAEKTAFMVVMFTISCVCILLSVVEGLWVLLRAKPWNRRPDDAKAVQLEPEIKQGRGFLRQLLALFHSHAGLLGKTVLPVLQLTRLLILGSVVEPVWNNDSIHFVCRTMQPGCTEAMYNKVFRFSLQQYWSIQVLLVLSTGLIFFSYLVHVIVKKGPGDWHKSHAVGAYLGLLVAVVLMEVGFAAGQAVIFGFFQCATVTESASWCPFQMECFVPKAGEKTLLAVIMFSVACLSGLLTLVEMCVVLHRERPWTKCHGKTMSETSGYQMSTLDKKEAEERIQQVEVPAVEL